MDSLPPLRVYALFMVSACAQTEFLLCPHMLRSMGIDRLEGQTGDRSFAFLQPVFVCGPVSCLCSVQLRAGASWDMFTEGVGAAQPCSPGLWTIYPPPISKTGRVPPFCLWTQKAL